MARQLWLLRHADAEPHGARVDAQRRLTQRGVDQARAAGAAIARLGGEFDAVLVSPKVRAIQTAELAADAWSAEQKSRLEHYGPLAEEVHADEVLELLGQLPPDGRLMLVGHEPYLSGLVAELTGSSVDLKKGGLAAVRLDGASGELAILMRPRELALIAGVPAGRE